MTTYPNILAWEIPWTEEPGGHRELDMTGHTRAHIYRQHPSFLSDLILLVTTSEVSGHSLLTPSQTESTAEAPLLKQGGKRPP